MAISREINEGTKALVKQTQNNKESVTFDQLDTVRIGGGSKDYTFDVDKVLIIPDVEHIEPYLGKSEFGVYLNTQTTDGEPKILFLSSLVKDVRIYTKDENGEIVWTGQTVHSNTKLYELLKNIRDAKTFVKVLAGENGRLVKIVGSVNTTVRAFNNNVVTGLVDKPLYLFDTFEEEEENKEEVKEKEVKESTDANQGENTQNNG